MASARGETALPSSVIARSLREADLLKPVEGSASVEDAPDAMLRPHNVVRIDEGRVVVVTRGTIYLCWIPRGSLMRCGRHYVAAFE